MNDKKKTLRTLGLIFFITGSLAGMVMFIFMNWANMEAYFYFGYSAPADKTLTTLRCPLLMTSSETAAITISLANDTKMDVAPIILTEISDSHLLVRSDKTGYPLAKGETRKLSWTVSSNDIVFGYFILAYVFVNHAYTLPSRARTCGTVVVNLPGLTGMQLFFTWLAFSLACMIVGWILWLIGSHSHLTEGLNPTKAMFLFTLAMLIGLLAGVTGWWFVGLLGCVACVLLILVVAVYYIQKA